MFESKNKKIMYTPVNPSFTIYKWGVGGLHYTALMLRTPISNKSHPLVIKLPESCFITIFFYLIQISRRKAKKLKTAFTYKLKWSRRVKYSSAPLAVFCSLRKHLCNILCPDPHEPFSYSAYAIACSIHSLGVCDQRGFVAQD